MEFNILFFNSFEEFFIYILIKLFIFRFDHYVNHNNQNSSFLSLLPYSISLVSFTWNMILYIIQWHYKNKNVYAFKIKLLNEFIIFKLIFLDLTFKQKLVQWSESSMCLNGVLNKYSLKYFIFKHQVNINCNLISNMHRDFIWSNKPN
jgi:hypothetical protein